MVTVQFTIRKFNPISWLIRWAIPRSRFALAMSSHCLIDAGDTIYEANMLHGVRAADRATALDGLTVVRTIKYNVPDIERGMTWLKAQVGKPYDWRGGLGLGLSPYREWEDDDRWFCFELVAGMLQASGRPVFFNLNHVSEIALMAITP